MKVAWVSLAISVAALAVALAARLRGCGAPPVPARIVFEKAEHDFGRVRPGKLLKAVFPFRNAGGEVLHLHMMTPCCGMRASASSYKLAPGASGTVEVQWRPDADIGAAREKIAVWSNDPDRRALELVLTAEVRPTFLVDPPRVDFGAVLYESEAFRRVRVDSPDERPLTLKLASTFLPGVRASCPTVGTRALSHTITLTAKPKRAASRAGRCLPLALGGELRIETDRNEGGAVCLPISLSVVGRVRPFPARLVFSTTGSGEPVGRTVSFEAREGLVFRVADARFTRGPFRASYRKSPPARRQEVRVTFLPSEIPGGRPTSAELRVQTDLEGEPTIRVPISVRAKRAEQDGGARTGGSLEVWLFYFPGCRGCREALRAVRKAEGAREGRLGLTIRDVARDPESVPLLLATADLYPGTPKVLPSMIAFVGDELLLGTREVASGVGRLFDRQLARGGEHLRVRRPGQIGETTPFAEGRAPPADAGRWDLGVAPVVLAGLVDGVNPCAFAAVVLLVSILSAGKKSGAGTSRTRLLLGGGAFFVAVFATYYLAGLGLFLGLRRLGGFTVVEEIVFWAVWALALAGGVLSAVDAVAYSRTGDTARLRLKVPEAIRRRFAPIIRGRFGRWGLVFGGLAGGAAIAVLEGVCTGQMYLPTIQYMARAPGLRASGAAWLLLYNCLFVLPLAAVLGVALVGVHFRRPGAFLTRHLGASKLGLAAVFFLLAAAMFLGR